MRHGRGRPLGDERRHRRGDHQHVDLAFDRRRDEAGKVTPLPHDLAGYFDFSTDLAQEVRQDMVDALEAFGIRVEAAHHEVAAGQHEIDFKYADALVTADNLVVFRSDRWAEGGVNVGAGTASETFTFARNWWYCLDQPTRSRPQLP